jgi:hypothetical protein
VTRAERAPVEAFYDHEIQRRGDSGVPTSFMG